MPSDFRSLGVRPELVGALQRSGIKEPTPVQQQAIPPLLNGQDVIAQAQTGTGKTLAFLLPILQQINPNSPHVQALILAPTRELALQVTSEAKRLAPIVGASVLAVYGGQDVDRQLNKLETGIHLVIATPGRFMDHMRRGTIYLKHVRMIVLDEADQMLAMGFLEDVEQVIRMAPPTRQVMLFSATMPPAVRALARRYIRKPVEIVIEGKKVTLEAIRQIALETSEESKVSALSKRIGEDNPYLALVFCRTKQGVQHLTGELIGRGIEVGELHGDLSQNKREQIMKRFREAKIQVLVATDLAARGLDVEGITHVYNFDLPPDVETYIHRIGRTGRAGETGVAVTFVTPRDRTKLAHIEAGVKAPMERVGGQPGVTPVGAAPARSVRAPGSSPAFGSRRALAGSRSGYTSARGRRGRP